MNDLAQKVNVKSEIGGDGEAIGRLVAPGPAGGAEGGAGL